MLMRTPSGALVDIAPEAVERFAARGFRAVDEPKPQKSAPKKRTSRSRKAAPKD